MSTYDTKRASIIIRTSDSREYKYVHPIANVNGALVGDFYEYPATTALTATQAFTDFGIVKGIVTSATDWISFDIDSTNGTLNYYTSNEKDIGGSNIRPIEMVALRKSAITDIIIVETAVNKQAP